VVVVVGAACPDNLIRVDDGENPSSCCQCAEVGAAGYINIGVCVYGDSPPSVRPLSGLPPPKYVESPGWETYQGRISLPHEKL